MEDIENSVSNESVVAEPIEQTASTEAVIEQAETPEVAKPVQTAEENSKWAEIRRRAEKAERELAQSRPLLDGYRNSAKALGYEGETHAEIVARMGAEREGISVEEYNKKLSEKSELEYLRAQALESTKTEHELIRTKDLLTLKAAFPEIKVNSIEELGDEFMGYMASGKYTVEVAYAMAKAAQEMLKKPVPPSIGSVKSNVPIEKEFYTSNEVDRLTSKELDNPKIMKRVMASMTKWNK